MKRIFGHDALGSIELIIAVVSIILGLLLLTPLGVLDGAVQVTLFGTIEVYVSSFFAVAAGAAVLLGRWFKKTKWRTVGLFQVAFTFMFLTLYHIILGDVALAYLLPILALSLLAAVVRVELTISD